MEVTSIASRLQQRPPAPSVAPAIDAVDLLAMRQIAATLYRRKSRNPRAILEDLSEKDQEPFITAAMVALRSFDDQFHIPGLYAAVDAADRFDGGDGIATVIRDLRISELARFEEGLKAYRAFLGLRDPLARAHFTKLAEADARRELLQPV